ncbi:AMMECR1 domain-containing protein [Multifurca ochricompacta]|uniref:AMMECR1 domain-containing protein n=1 Tax=Multifurca ochricompacta TaxID=376703 RepID=A0AAD4QN18_9AGAM|nr:AMMECR1 domain-containing protein [Multifurca ochricompacta]
MVRRLSPNNDNGTEGTPAATIKRGATTTTEKEEEAVASTAALPTTVTVCRPEYNFHAFDELYCELLEHEEPIKPLFSNDKYPLFVTWNTRRRSYNNSSSGTRLRGCIGTFEAQPLRTAIREYALLSAFRDHRFHRIELHELPSLECGISLLTDFEDANSYLDWTVGIHGIQITFTPPPTSTPASDAPSPLSSAISLLPRFSPSTTRTLSATYLPEVAPEQGWDHIDAIDSAIRKAGWVGRISEDLRRSLRVRRYQSRKCVVGWDEFVAWRASKGLPVDLDAIEGSH